MELGLSLGETQKQYKCIEKSQDMVKNPSNNINDSLGFCMALSSSFSSSNHGDHKRNRFIRDNNDLEIRQSSSDPLFHPLHLPPNFSPHSHLPAFPWLHQNSNLISEPGNGYNSRTRKVRDVAEEEEEGATGSSSNSPNSTISSFRMEFGMYGNNKRNNREVEMMGRGGISDDEEEENGMLARKKLRLTKDQSAFLEESFKEHNTLNPKQKLALAKQLSLRPRQVEVWFQNRRARTKLKQTEVDCEYLKRCCETLTEENRRLQKELLELRTLKSASKPFHMQLPATTLTMCPSCERIASSTTTSAAINTALPATTTAKPRLHAFLQDQAHALQAS